MDHLSVELDALEKTVNQSEGMPKKESEKRKGIVAEYKAKFDVMRNGILESINNVSPSGVILLHNL